MSLSRRQLWALYFLKYNEELTAAIYSKEQKTSARTAQRDLADLVSKGLLTAHGKNRSQYYKLSYS